METSALTVEASTPCLTEEQLHRWYRGTIEAVDQKINSNLSILKQQAKKRALNLLRRFITSPQWEDYNSLGCFSQKDGKGRIWKFKKEHHYPIECNGTPICIDAERGAPDEDLLLQVWLEVIGGRGKELLPSVCVSFVSFSFLEVLYRIIPTNSFGSSHGVLYGIS